MLHKRFIFLHLRNLNINFCPKIISEHFEFLNIKKKEKIYKQKKIIY